MFILHTGPLLPHNPSEVFNGFTVFRRAVPSAGGHSMKCEQGSFVKAQSQNCSVKYLPSEVKLTPKLICLPKIVCSPRHPAFNGMGVYCLPPQCLSNDGYKHNFVKLPLVLLFPARTYFSLHHSAVVGDEYLSPLLPSSALCSRRAAPHRPLEYAGQTLGCYNRTPPLPPQHLYNAHNL